VNTPLWGTDRKPRGLADSDRSGLGEPEQEYEHLREHFKNSKSPNYAEFDPQSGCVVHVSICHRSLAANPNKPLNPMWGAFLPPLVVLFIEYMKPRIFNPRESTGLFRK
jgi:hypothetical protein